MKNYHHDGDHKTHEQCSGWGHGHHRRKFHKLIGLFLFLTIIFFFPFHKINWGTLNLGSQSTISVTGSAEDTQKNQIATFRAGATVENTDKETAVQEVNTKMTELVAALKKFGIEEDDLETQRVSTYETYINSDTVVNIYPPRPEKRIKGWRASNFISIILRDVDRASELTDLLNESGATDVSGPNFRVDDIDELERELLQKALDDARKKAESMLEKSGQRVGKIVRLSEGSSGGYEPISYRSAELMTTGGGVPTPIETGSQKITKTVTVVFEITR